MKDRQKTVVTSAGGNRGNDKSGKGEAPSTLYVPPGLDQSGGATILDFAQVTWLAPYNANSIYLLWQMAYASPMLLTSVSYVYQAVRRFL